MSEDELMLTAILNCKRSDLYVDPPELTVSQLGRLQWMKERRLSQEPLQYIIGETEFMGLKLKVDRRALIPRLETEILVEQVLQTIEQDHHAASLNALDIGTGSGNIAISLARSVPGLRVWAIDASAEALELARHNSRVNSVASQIDFAQVDAREFCNNYADAKGRFDIIVSNPPYIRTGDLANLPADVRQEPVLALDGGVDGLNFYRFIIPAAKDLLKSHGVLACEFGDGQEKSIEELLVQNGFKDFKFINDLRPTPRLFIAHV